jgi:hypothetical protein
VSSANRQVISRHDHPATVIGLARTRRSRFMACTEARTAREAARFAIHHAR